MKAGYLHPGYAESLAEFGTPRLLPRSEGWALEREVPGFPFRDAMGCYPLFACQDWSQLPSDLDGLGGQWVSLALVADPFGAYDPADLCRWFDVVRPFKEHFVTDLRRPPQAVVSKHRRHLARKALRRLSVERCAEPVRHLGEWLGLYATLTQRHRLRGVQAFSERAFARQLSVPGITMFRAVSRGTTVGADLWYEQGEVGYGHLAALSPEGYRLGASYALLWSAIEYFAGRVRWLHLGAGAGAGNAGDDGLTAFKRGWATGTRTAYFCGRVFDRQRYAEAANARGAPADDYFPAYRKDEFA
jgi:hypothetical protein